MSFGGSDKTTVTPEVPPELADLFAGRSSVTAEQLPAVIELFRALASGDTSKTSAFTSGTTPLKALEGVERRNEALSRTPSAGGQLDRALTRGIVKTEGGRAEAESGFNRNLFDTLLKLVGAEQQPLGGSSTSTSDPGILGYINIVSNLVSSYGQSGLDESAADSYGSFGPPGGQQSGGSKGSGGFSGFAKLFGGSQGGGGFGGSGISGGGGFGGTSVPIS